MTVPNGGLLGQELPCPNNAERKDSLSVNSDHSRQPADMARDSSSMKKTPHQMHVVPTLTNGRLAGQHEDEPGECQPTRNGGGSPCPPVDVPEISVSSPDHEGTAQNETQPEPQPSPPPYPGPAAPATASTRSKLRILPPHLIPPPPPPSIPRPPSPSSTYPSPLSQPPPPPPPPNPLPPHGQPAAAPELSPRRLRRFMSFLEETRDQQEDHHERREQALLERQALHAKRQALRAQRLRTRDAQAGLISELRRTCLNAKPPEPAAVFALFDAVERAHDALGASEEDYDADERRYDVLELQWTKNEGDIVGNLVEDIEELGIVPPPRAHAGVGEENDDGDVDCQRHAVDPRPATSPDFRSTEEAFPAGEAAAAATPGTPVGEVRQGLAGYSWKSDDDDARAGTAAAADALVEGRPGGDDAGLENHRHQLWEAVRPHMDVLKGVSTDEGRRASEPARRQGELIQAAAAAAAAAARRPRSEADLAGVLEPGWQSNIRSQVSQWIMDSLKGSLVQKALAKAQLEEDGLDEKDWWVALRRVWSTDAANDEPEAGGGEEEEEGEEEEDDYVNIVSDSREGVSVDWS
ncbi:uncharacterized protein BKCO1_19000174 [Diplodia corticola]|uniref:Uncharacterized protein n=1 Tax=Diplodia corticola TaxID=236234 RepID=A0A1J9R331_9PEZI|nr:uncharacterized protein BKCO1_19000174 [Diplodia corticola]OJD34985.1 hypothetical protein BKCO1_19000174 [Diplodia corticola]